MNPLNRFCQIASLLCCMALGAEGFLFVHTLSTQARSMNSSLTAAVDAPHPARSTATTKVALN